MQDLHSVGPVLGPNCLQTEGYQKNLKLAASKERIKEHKWIILMVQL